jgi:hypothetical protein
MKMTKKRSLWSLTVVQVRVCTQEYAYIGFQNTAQISKLDDTNWNICFNMWVVECSRHSRANTTVLCCHYTDTHWQLLAT